MTPSRRLPLCSGGSGRGEFGISNFEFGNWDLGSGIWELEFGIWGLELGILSAFFMTPISS
jgi:hypothetical protein